MLTVTSLKRARSTESSREALRSCTALQITDRITELELSDFRGLGHIEQLIIGPQLDEMRPGARPRSRTPTQSRARASLLVPPFVFSELKGLKELHITMKGVRRLSRESFVGLEQLETLVLSGNRINAIEPGTFRELTHLTSLHLDHNRLTEINPSYFSELPGLVRLNLSANQIKKIEPRSFVDNTKLLILDLSYNGLSQVDRGTFDGLTNLSQLDLSGNPLGQTEKTFLIPLPLTTQLSFHTQGRIQTLSKWEWSQK
jgi:Leucine-rich repeat (LRR) protein